MVKESSDLSLRKDKGGGSHSFFFLLVWANSVETSTSSYFLVLTSLMEREDCPSSCFLISEISLSLTELHPALFWIPWSPWPPRPPQLPRPPLPGPQPPLGQGCFILQQSRSSHINFFFSNICVHQHYMSLRRLLLLISETWVSQLLLDIFDVFVSTWTIWFILW